MKSMIFVVPAISAILSVYSLAEDKVEHLMTLACSKNKASLGDDLNLHLELSNIGAEPWQLTRPDISMTTYLRYKLKDRSESAQGSSLGTVTVTTTDGENGEAIEARNIPPQEKISITAGRPYKYSLSLFARMVDCRPGTYLVWMEETEERILSNKVEIELSVDEASVPLLINILVDESKAPWKREEAVAWLRKLQPSFSYKVDTAASEKIRIENSHAVTELKEFWSKLENKKDLLLKVNNRQ